MISDRFRHAPDHGSSRLARTPETCCALSDKSSLIHGGFLRRQFTSRRYRPAVWRYHRATSVNYSRPKHSLSFFIVEGCKYGSKNSSSDTCFTGQHLFNNQVQLYLASRMIFTFTMNHLFISAVRGLCVSASCYRFWRAVCVVYHLGLNLFCHSDWRGSWPPLMMAGVRSRQPVFLLLAFCYCADTNFPATSAAQCRADWPVIAGCR